jgi:hypothetical protein
MSLALTPHPDTPCAALRAISVSAERGAGSALALRYVATGDVAGLRLPDVAKPARADELWKHTCFEAFIRAPDELAYIELNFSPSTAWAVYAFDGYRVGMRDAEIVPPYIAVAATADRLEITVAVTLPMLANTTLWRLALAAVIEDAAGAKSYWALAHAPGKPDFHHPDGFAHDLMERS